MSSRRALKWIRRNQYLLRSWLWMLAIIPTLLWWRESILWLATMSLYANIETAFGAHEASKARFEGEKRWSPMARLKAARRKKLPKSKFGLPGSRKYPINDRKHAANAKARATQMMKKGKISRSTRNKIHARANRVLRRR